MAKKKKLKVVSKKKKKVNKRTFHTGHMNDMVKRISELEARVAELERLKKGIVVKWAGYPNEIKN